jgi:hypothetical protein
VTGSLQKAGRGHLLANILGTIFFQVNLSSPALIFVHAGIAAASLDVLGDRYWLLCHSKLSFFLPSLYYVIPNSLSFFHLYYVIPSSLSFFRLFQKVSG